MRLNYKIVTVSAFCHFNFSYFTCFAQFLQVAIDSLSPDIGMIFNNFFKNFVSSYMAMKFFHCV